MRSGEKNCQFIDQLNDVSFLIKIRIMILKIGLLNTGIEVSKKTLLFDTSSEIIENTLSFTEIFLVQGSTVER
jgi:hypothetical protein